MDQTQYLFNISYFYNTFKYKKHVDTILKIKLGSDLYIRVFCFYKAFFKDIKRLETAAITDFINCQKNYNPFYSKKLSLHNRL